MVRKEMMLMCIFFVLEVQFSKCQFLDQKENRSTIDKYDILLTIKEIQMELSSQRQQALENGRLLNDRLVRLEAEFSKYRKESLERMEFLSKQLNGTNVRVSEVETNINE